MAIRLAISVEGNTEENFVNKVLSPYLYTYNSNLTKIQPINIKGGVSLKKVKKDLKILIYSFDRVTTLYDFYGFAGNKENKYKLEDDIISDLKNEQKHKVIPYVQMYEYEALLFSKPDTIENIISSPNIKNIKSWAENILKKFNYNPESINNSPETAPSKRLSSKGYLKTIHGHLIAKEIGIPKIKEMCPYFKEWVEKLEQIK